MNIEQILKDALNLSEFQILVYQSLLERTGTAGQLLKRLNINRATLYRVLDELVSLNLVIKKQVKTRMFFEALHPDSLINLYEKRRVTFEEKGKSLERVVHELLNKANSLPSDASISIEKGIHAHYRKMKLKLNCKEKIIRQKLNNDSTIYELQEYPEGRNYMEFMKEFIKTRVKKDIHLRILTNATLSPKLRPFNVSSPNELKEVKIIPSEILPNFSFDVFDDYVIFTERYEKPDEMVVITIRNEVTATLMKTLFDFVFDRSISTYRQKPIPTFTTLNGIELPQLGIGTSGIGGYWYGLHPYVDDIGDTDQLRHALSKGMSYIDTCLMYGGGHSVEVVGKAIKNIPRADIFINGKLTRPNGVELQSIKEVEEQCNRYLKILGVEHLDQFQIHSQKTLGNVPEEDVIQKIGELITVGKVKNWGVSNYTYEDLLTVRNVIKEPLLSNEIPFGVFNRDYEKDGTLPYMQQNNIATIAYFTVKMGGMQIDQFFGTDKDTLLAKLAEKYKKTPVQIAINWVINHPRTMALIKSTNGTHVNENVGAIGWEMEEKDYELLGEESPI
ncbi:aldo/keto reductase [bacterium]|nr:aldo/keto reductase [bacterium]